MKLSLKIFLLTLLLFIIAFYAGIFLMSELSYAASLETARKQAFTEYNFIAYSFTNDLGALLKRNQGDKSINSLMSSYLGYYKKQDVFLQLINKGGLIAGNLPAMSLPDVIQNPSNETKSIIASESAQKYIFVSCDIQNDYVLVYARDISSLVDAQKQLTTKLMLSGIGITLIYIIILYFIIRRLTKPIRVLQNITKKITAGEYDVRANVNGKDEVSILAANFNNMAEEVLSKIEELKKISSQKQQFIDNLAHELKTPLTAIYGNAELLQKTKVSEEYLIDTSSDTARCKTNTGYVKKATGFSSNQRFNN